MSSSINTSELNYPSNIPLSNLDIESIRKINKTPDSMILKRTNRLSNILKTKRIKNSNINLGASANFRHLTLNKEKNENDNNKMQYKRKLITKINYEKISDDLDNINKKITDNKRKIEKLNENLNKLKEDKKQKKSEIINLLSNKESLEEIYKNKMYYLIKNKDIKSNQKNDINNVNDNNNNKNNRYIKYTNYINDVDNERKTFNNLNDSEIIRFNEEKELEINIEDIKKSDQKKFVEQVISFTDDIIEKNNEEFYRKIKDKINFAYKIFFSEISSTNVNKENNISNFFLRISLYISNTSLGHYSELNINKILRYLLKINSIGAEISQIIKFLNKRYKELKNKIKEQISDLHKRNENFDEKRIILEKKKIEMKNFLELNKEYFNAYDNDKSINNTETKPENYNTLDDSYSQKIMMLRSVDNFKEEYSKTSRRNKDYMSNKILHERKNKNLATLTMNNINKKLLMRKKADIYFNQGKENNKTTIYKGDNEFKNKRRTLTISTIIDMDNSSIPNKKTIIDLSKINSKKLNLTDLLKIKNNKNNSKNEQIHQLLKKMKTNNTVNNEDNEICDNKTNNIKNVNYNNKIRVNNLVIKNDININTINDRDNLNENKLDNLKIKKTNTSGINNKIFKKINKNNIKYPRNRIIKNDITNKMENNMIPETNLSTEINKNILYNKNSFSIPKNQYNKNIYIINNINNNNSEKIHTENNNYKSIEKNNNNLMNSSDFRNIKNIFNEDLNLYNGTNNSSGDIKNKTIFARKQKIISNELLNNSLKNTKCIFNEKLKTPNPKLSNLFNIINSQTPNHYIRINKMNKNAFKNNVLEQKNIINSIKNNNAYIISNDKIKINNKEYRLIKSKKKGTTIPITSYMKDIYNKNYYDEKKEEKLNKTKFSAIHHNDNLISPLKRLKLLDN